MPQTEADTAQILHNLRVHEIELEMQNEDLRRAQVELDAVRARYFDLYDLAPVGYVTLSEHSLILEANLTAATLLGVPRGALVKQPFPRFILTEDADIYYRCRKQLFESGEPQACEVRIVPQGGANLWAHLAATAAQDDKDAPVCRMVLTDITSDKQAEERKKLEAQNRLLQKSESLSRMAGAIAHTFNNQLQAAMMNLEVAMKELPQNAGLAEPLANAMKAVRKTADASGLMLTYVGQTAGKRVPVDLSKVCQRSVTLVRAGMLPKSVILEADLPAPGPTIKADANQIQQALTNLLANAWEACGGRGGAIHLRVREVAAAEIPAPHRFPVDSQLQAERYACVELADTGCGIAEEDIEKVFDPFFSTKFTGRGIGLAVVVGILRGHGGAATVESKLGVGTVFRVFLPIATEAALPQAISVAPLPKASRSGTVLVVDDEPMVCRTAASELRREGFAVLTARDGLEAVEVFRAQQQEIRLVLCDFPMPRLVWVVKPWRPCASWCLASR